jgi:Protein of unknown function (DUF732)
VPSPDVNAMKRNHIAAVASLVVSAGLLATAVAAPAHADPASDLFLTALANQGLTGVDRATAVAVGQSVCPLLVEPGQTAANVVADVADAIGRPLGPATMFTGLAISIFCPGAVASLANGQSPVPLPLLGL